MVEGHGVYIITVVVVNVVHMRCLDYCDRLLLLGLLLDSLLLHTQDRAVHQRVLLLRWSIIVLRLSQLVSLVKTARSSPFHYSGVLNCSLIEFLRWNFLVLYQNWIIKHPCIPWNTISSTHACVSSFSRLLCCLVHLILSIKQLPSIYWNALLWIIALYCLLISLSKHDRCAL